MFLAAEFRIMVQTVLDSPANDGFRIYKAVGFCHNTSIYGTRLMTRGRTMVFGGICHYIDLFLRKPLP